MVHKAERMDDMMLFAGLGSYPQQRYPHLRTKR